MRPASAPRATLSSRRHAARFAAPANGPAIPWAAKAGRALRWGVLLRLAGRRVARPFLTASRREEGRADDQVLRNALEALSRELAIPGQPV